MIFQIFLCTVSVKYDLLIRNVFRNFILSTDNDSHSFIFLILSDCFQFFHINCKKCLTAGTCTFTFYIIFRPACAHIADIRDPHFLVALFDGVTNHFDILKVIVSKTCLFCYFEVVYTGCVNTCYLTGNTVDRNRIFGSENHICLNRNRHMRAVSTCRTHSIHDIDIGTTCAPYIHHSHGQILLMHLHMYFILYNTFNIL